MIDIHTNLGIFPGGKKINSQHHYCSVDDLVDHVHEFNLTIIVVLYPYDGYELLVELQDKLPETVVIGLQCLFHYDEKRVDSNLKIDCIDLSKKLAFGVKFHSHRGYWRDGRVGLDYSDESFIGGILRTLPENSICSFHTQGTTSLENKSNPFAIGRYASRFPHLKFIINHSGDYGPAMTSAKPSTIIQKNSNNCDLMLRHCISRALISSSIELSRFFHNIFLDTSNFTYHKGELLSNFDKWCIGTDIPFGDKKFYSYKNELNNFLKFMPIETFYRAQEKTKEFLFSDWKDLLKEREEYGSTYYQDIRRKIK